MGKDMSDLRVFEQMVAANPDRMSFVDANYIYREVNQTYLNDHQCRREDIIGKHISEFLGRETFQRIKPLFDSSLSGNPVRYQKWFDFAVSGRRYMDVVYYPYREPDGTIIGVVVTARDCTVQQIASESLAETKTRLDLMTETIEDVVWFTDLDGPKVLFVSAGYERIWGRPVSELYARPLDWMDAVHPDDRAQVEAAFRTSHSTGAYAAEYRIVRPDGGVRWIDDRGLAVQQPGGKSTKLAGIARDITARKELEQALEFERRRLQAFLSNSLVAAYMKDEEGRYVFVNDLTVAHFETPLEEWLGKTDAQIWPGPGAVQIRNNDLAILQSGESKEALECTLTKAGRLEWWISNKFPFIDADGTRYLGGLSVNVTDRVLAQEERQKFVLLAERSQDFIGICDNDRVPIYVNPAGRALVGLESPEAARQIMVRDFFFPEDQEFIREEFLPRVAREGHGEIEIRFRHLKTGAAIWMRSKLFLLKDLSGHSVGWGTISRDMTEQRRAAEERLEHEKRLAHSQKLEAIGKLAAGMAHDVNSLFMVISGNAELIESRLPQGQSVLAEQKREALNRIKDAVDRGKALLNKLLLFGRLRTQLLGPVALNSVVQETMKLIQISISSRVQVHLQLSIDLWLCNSEFSQLLQVVMNLILNANDAMPTGGMLTISTKNVEVTPEHSARHADAHPGPHVLLSVQDTGSGMDAEVMNRVLEPYFSTKPVDKGSGLGLSIVYAVVKQFGGHITIASEVGKVTEVCFYMPAITQQS